MAAYRRVVADLASRVRAEHDDVAIEKLSRWIEQARNSKGKQDVLLQVGRDGVFVQTRPCWEEASCGTVSVYDRGGRRLGTVYLGQMPESDQPTMTGRLTHVITGVLSRCGSEPMRLVCAGAAVRDRRRLPSSSVLSRCALEDEASGDR